MGTHLWQLCTIAHLPLVLTQVYPTVCRHIRAMAGGGATGVATERGHLPVRWLMLVLLCVALLGSYYCYDNPTALLNNVGASQGWKASPPQNAAGLHPAPTPPHR